MLSRLHEAVLSLDFSAWYTWAAQSLTLYWRSGMDTTAEALEVWRDGHL